MHAKATASNHLAKANRATHGPRVMAKERVRRVRENPKENPKVPKTRIKTSKTGLYGLEKPEIRSKFRNSGICTDEPTDNSYTDNSWCDDGWSYDEWKDDWSSVGWHEGCV